MSHPTPFPVAELVEDETAPDALPGAARRGVFGAARAAAGWCFGVASLVLGLAVLAAVPLGQFLALGYLLESAGRVARSGRLRDGFIGVRTAARFGGLALVGFVMWLPLYFLSIQAEAARIIDPHGPAARQAAGWLAFLAVLAATHAVGGLLRGGRVRHFLNPFNVPWVAVRFFSARAHADARDRLWVAVVGLRLPYYFWLGVRGFVGAFLWLAVPLALLAQGHRAPAVGFVGGCLLAVVVLYVPLLQVRFARDGRVRAFRELGAVRRGFRAAPLAFALALWVHLLLAIPLYLLKIEVIPRDLLFVEGVLFLLLMFPARLLGGWAVARAARRAEPRGRVARWGARAVVLPVAVAYVLVVFASQHLGWQGVRSLYEQHAFLLPVPFVTWNG